MNDRLGKTLRTVAIILMALTATMNLLGGVGTVCAAFLTEQFESMAPFLEYQLLYQVIMITTIILGVAGVWGTIQLVKRRENAYRNTMIILIIGTVLAGVQYYSSLAIRGSAAPANIKFYTNAITLLFFLFLRIPGIWERVGLETPGGDEGEFPAAGLAAMFTGGIVLTTLLWAGPSHTYNGVNWIHVLRPHLLIIGMVLILGGALGLIADPVRAVVNARSHFPLTDM